MKKIKALLYCCKNKPQIFYEPALDKPFVCGYEKVKNKQLNGKIVAECDCYTSKIWYGVNEKNEYINFMAVCDDACLTLDEIDNYLKGENGYVIHIKNLNIFDKPRELSDYWKKGERVKIAPQNMMLVQNIYEDKVAISLKEVKTIKVEEYILISIRPEWLCKILNGEKTIEIRRKVLKEMITDA